MTKSLGDIPRGIEVLVKKAAVDAAFREALLRERGAAAGRIGLALEPAEQAMLAAIPARQLEQVIAGTRVPAPLRAAFMGYAAAAMLAALWANRGYCEDIATEGSEGNDGLPSVGGFYKWVGEHRGSQNGEAIEQGFAAISVEVIDQNNQPVAGALIVVIGTNRYATTDATGHCLVTRIPPGKHDLKASRVGYGEKTVKNISIKEKDNSPLVFILTSTLVGGIRPDEIRNHEHPSALNTLMNKIFGKDVD